jgi:hypothetical protein
MLGRGHEGEPRTLTAPDALLGVSLRKQGEEPVGRVQVRGDQVPQRREASWSCRGQPPSGPAGGGFLVRISLEGFRV